MSFKEELQSISRSKQTIQNDITFVGEAYTDVEAITIFKLNEIKTECRMHAYEENYLYNLNTNKKTLYGHLVFPAYSVPREGLFNCLYTYSKSGETVYLTPTGKRVFKDLKYACRNNDIDIKIGRRLPESDKISSCREWFANSLYEEASESLEYQSPYQMYLGFRVIMDMTPEEITREKTKQANSSESCYIATAVYGSYDCPEVWTLRRVRDYMLAKTWYGRTFIRTYYAISPSIVKMFGGQKWFVDFTKKPLDILVNHMRRLGYSDLPYEDLNWRKKDKSR